jgi:DNA-binding NarL/FixJ family response regulator
MSAKKHVNVFIVEDNEVYAKILQGFIITHFPEVKTKIFSVGETCLMELHHNPNIVIMDYYLNSKYGEAQNGLEIIKRIKDHDLKTNIIVLSAQDKYNVVLEAIKQYNCFYVQKGEEAFNKLEHLINNFILLGQSVQGSA